MNCEICKKEFSNITKLVSHLTHPKSSCKIDVKEYYDKFLKRDDEGFCLHCGDETKFYGLSKGYPIKYCKKYHRIL